MAKNTEQYRKAVGGILIENNKILLLYHNKFVKWVIPVGKVDVGEDIDTAIKREFFEEVGATIQTYSTVFTGVVDSNVEINEKVDFTVFQIHTYSSYIFNKEPHKHKHLQFMSRHELHLLEGIGMVDDLTLHLLDLISFT